MAQLSCRSVVSPLPSAVRRANTVCLDDIGIQPMGMQMASLGTTMVGERSHSVRARLRESSQEVHERLHDHPAFAAILRGDMTFSAYRELLTKLQGFHVPLERTLLSAAEDCWFGLAPARYRIADRIENDLSHLGGALDRGPGVSFQAFETTGLLLGALYVREGAAIGGRMLARKLDGLFGDSTLGRSFLSGQPEDAARWQHTCAALEQAGAAGHLDEMMAGAHATFKALETWLDLGEVGRPARSRE